MNTSIVTIDIKNNDLLKELEKEGFNIIQLEHLDSLMTVNEDFSFVLLSNNIIKEIGKEGLEKYYFYNNKTPTAVLCSPNSHIEEYIPHSFDILYDTDIPSTALCKYITKLILFSKLNSDITKLQERSNSEEILEHELSLRNQLLSHERDISTNILSSITSGVIIVDLEGNIILLNNRAEEMIPESNRKDILGSSYKQLPTEIGNAVSDILTTDKNSFSEEIVRKCTVESRILKIYGYHLKSDEQEKNGIILLINDITEEEEANQLLYRSEKLATVGTMLSGIAHELRNPLSIISARVQMAKMKKEHTEESINKVLKTIETQSERCANIVNSLLNFTRNTATNSGYHKAAEVMDETLNYVNYQNTFDNVEVIKNYDSSLLVYGDRSRFVQIFINLITNAVDAMEGKGKLIISTSREKNGNTLITVKDNGPGIDTMIENKLFDPFFTTKEPGKGTGLGLSIVYKIVTESNGKIWFESKPGETTFFIILPSEKGDKR